MNVIMTLADKVIPDRRASRDFRAKYPDDVLLDQINGEKAAVILPGALKKAAQGHRIYRNSFEGK